MPHLILGLILAGLGVWGVIAWWGLFGLVMRGVVPFFFLVVGLVAILASLRRFAARSADEGAMHFDMHSAEGGGTARDVDDVAIAGEGA